MNQLHMYVFIVPGDLTANAAYLKGEILLLDTLLKTNYILLV